MNIQTEKSFLIDLLQNTTDVSLIQKVKNFVLKEIDSAILPNKEHDQMIAESEEDIKNGKIHSQDEVQKIIESWTA
jgi:hypothetical protein